MYRIFLDVETTGLKSYNSHVIEASAVVVDPGFKEVDRFHSLANPGEEALAQASPEAFEVNQIALDEVRKAPTIIDVAANLRKFLERFPQTQYHAYNNDFDLWFLARSPWSIASRNWGECIMLATQKIMEEAGTLKKFPDGNPKWPSLQEAAKFFGIPMEQTHRALDDARMAALIYREILRRREELILEDEASFLQEEGT